jgi:KH/beta-lactamase-domain protein
LTPPSLNEVHNRIAETVLKNVPKEAEVSRIEYEGPMIAIYSKRPEVLIEQSHILTGIVDLIKKRIVLRSDPSVRMPEREANKLISEMISDEAEITNIVFDPTVGEVIIESKKPGIVIGKNGSALQGIIKSTRWRPRVLRSPPIPSKIVSNIRHYVYTESKERERILRTIGERIFRPSVLATKSVYLTPLGGFQEVGRSAILIQTNESRILLDCGLNPGSPNPVNAYPRLSADVFDLASLDAVIISHAHLDHCGFLPFLYKYGYDGPVYCSEPTASLMTLLQLDYLDVAKKEGAHPPYDQRAVKKAIIHTIPMKPGTVTDISPDIRLTIHNAGHILGSSVIHLHLGEGLHNIVYTSDFKYGRTMLLEPAVSSFPRVETLIVESTYGSTRDYMPARKDAESKLISLINSTVEKGGKVLIPVPAVGRAQEIMLILDGYMRAGLIKETPVYIEGMVNEATAIHTTYPEYLARDVRELIFHKGINPFQSEYFVTVKAPNVRQEILQGGPCIIVATSGMLEGGPSVEYFKALSDDERNTILFVSYQIEGTLGHRLQKGIAETQLMTHEGRIEVIKIRLKTESVEGFSGHSDRRQIYSYLKRIFPKPNLVVVNHGERSKCLGLANSIRKFFVVQACAPRILETRKLK